MPTDDLAGVLDISLSGILSSLIFGVIGMWMLGRGRKNANYKIIAIAFALMIYPYFTTGPIADWGVGTALCYLAYYYWY